MPELELIDTAISFFAFHILYLSFRFTTSYNCNQKFSIWLQTHLAIIAFIRLKYHLTKYQKNIKNFFKTIPFLNIIFEIVSVITLKIFSLTGVYLIYNDIHNDDCCFHEMILFFILLILILLIFLYFVNMCSWVWRFNEYKKDYKEIFLKESLVRIYENTKKNSFILNYFIKNNELQLLKIGILNVEEKILLKRANSENNRDFSSECVICQDFLVDKRNKIVEIGCRHNFHFDCIVPWLKKKPTCPLCKAHFRLNLRI